MIHLPLRPNSLQVEALFAAERTLVAESAGVRERVMERVRASVPRNPGLQSFGRSSMLRRLRIGEMAVAAVWLCAFCAAAFYAGYHTNSEQGAAPATLPASAPPRVTASAVVAASANAPAPAQPETAAPESSHVRSRSMGPSRAVSETEAFAKELSVLQPARQAVARQDFALALGAIAAHQRNYPAGKLSEEREALRVKALLGLGRVAEAERAGTAFHARFPRSALIGRIDEMLGRSK